MKNQIITLFIAFFCILKLQAQPEWNKTFGLPADTGAVMEAVKVKVDITEQIYVLGHYYKPGSGNTLNKVYLLKYDETGTLLWQYVFDNAGNNNVRGYDLELDNNNNAYIAGGKTDVSPYGVFLLKVTASGSTDWLEFANSSFSNDWYTKVTYRNNLIYARGNAGVAVYDVNGNEQFSIAQYNSAFDVDYAGRIVLSMYAPTYNLIRYTNTGAVDFTASTIQSDKIVCSYVNEIYLTSGLSGMSPYFLAKFNTLGQSEWTSPGFSQTPPFGDFNYGVYLMNNSDVLLSGINDSIYRFDTNGNLIWKTPMNGLDNDLASGQLIYNSFYLYTGTINGFGGQDIISSIVNLNGQQIWQEAYSGMVGGGSDFAVDINWYSQGIYLLTQLADSLNLVKYTDLSGGLGGNVDFSQVCVDSIWIDSANQVHVNVFNGSFNNLNYPFVDIVSPAGDTISNGAMSFFAHLSNTFVDYVQEIDDSTITDFSGYVVLMHNSFNPDTVIVINNCLPTGLNSFSKDSDVLIYPVPASEHIFVSGIELKQPNFMLIDVAGKTYSVNQTNQNNLYRIDLSNLSPGLYVLTFNSEKGPSQRKVMVSR